MASKQKLKRFNNNTVIHKTAVYVVDTASCTTQISQKVATCLYQLYGHPQATRAHKTKTRIANFILGQTEISV